MLQGRKASTTNLPCCACMIIANPSDLPRLNGVYLLMQSLCKYQAIQHKQRGTVDESVECKSPVREIWSWIPDRVKQMTYKIDTCCFLAWCSVLIGEGKDSLVYCQDNVTEWDIMSWFGEA